MKLTFTVHFKFRLAQRGIDIDYIKQVIMRPDETSQYPEGQIVSIKAISGRKLKVVYIKDFGKSRGIEYRIISAYYLDK